jgi:hypothetical protein
MLTNPRSSTKATATVAIGTSKLTNQSNVQPLFESLRALR